MHRPYRWPALLALAALLPLLAGTPSHAVAPQSAVTSSIAPMTGIIGISAADHTCAITSSGALYCWGKNTNGQLGDGTTIHRLTPVPVSGLNAGVQMTATGWGHTCALATGGTLQCWGLNDQGQLGTGETVARFAPTTIPFPGPTIQAIAAGSLHTCALTLSGTVFCWGRNSEGQVGDGTTANRLTPVQVGGLPGRAIMIASGAYHTCALLEDRTGYCWGQNTYGEVGDGTTTNRATPVRIASLSGVTQLTGYLEALGLPSGWLVVFDVRAGRSWEDRLWQREVEHRGHRITVLGA
jgi:alpha-tubulin suppressor-like RCC1 family protein